MNNHTKPEEIKDRFIGEIGRLGESIGLNRMTCQMYALLYLEEGTLSLTELSRMLHISKGSASLNIRKLEEWGAVKPIWRKGSTQNYYQANRDLWAVARKRVKVGLERRLNLVQEGIAGIMKDAGKENKGSSPEAEKLLKIYRSRFAELEGLSRKVKNLLKFL